MKYVKVSLTLGVNEENVKEVMEENCCGEDLAVQLIMAEEIGYSIKVGEMDGVRLIRSSIERIR